MLSRRLFSLWLAAVAIASGAGPATAQGSGARPQALQRTSAPTREWAVGRWYLDKDQCRGRSFLILKANGTYILEEFDSGTWILNGNAFRREPRLMYLGDGLTKPTSYLRIVPTTDRIDHVDERRMIYTVGSTGFRGTLTRCG
jgi:hypothetical protein